MQSISRAFYKPGIVHMGTHDTVLSVVDPQQPASTKESSHDAKWRLGDPNLDPDLVSN